jgi:lipopolysaccharide exporter
MGPDLYRPDRFAHVSLSSFAQSLAEQPHRAGVVRLNRRLLQEAYPQFIEETVLDSITGVAVLRLLALLMILGALTNPGVILFRKDLNFRKNFGFESACLLTAAVTTIVLAFVLRSVWALVYGRLLGAVLRCLISYRVHPFRPRLMIDRTKAAELWHYGKWVFLTTVVAYFQSYGDNLFVAKFLGPTALGMYVLAYRLSQLPATEITGLLGNLLFPAYARLQHDRPRLRQAYLKVLSVAAVVGIPTAGLIFLLAPDFVHTFLTPEWRPVIPVLQVLAVKGLTHSLHATFGAVYQAVGLPGITTKLQVIRVILLCLLIYPLTARWGVLGTALTVVLIGLVMQPFGYGMLIGVIHCRVRDVLIRIAYPLAATSLALLAAIVLRRLVFSTYSLISLVLSGAFAVGVYALLIGIADRWTGYSIVALVREMLVTALPGKARPAKPRR